MNTNRISLSAALIVLLCFFLPWIQVGCGASQNRLSGVDLARDVHVELWIIPLLMIAVLFVNLARAWREQRTVVAIVNLISGLFSAYLMNRERSRADHHPALLQVSVTGWFWLGFAATIALVVIGCVQFLRKKG
jgi:undecaprenyl pyrophosphate phosphatase UppP